MSDVSNDIKSSTKNSSVSSIPVKEPKLYPEELRRELFKFYYATQNPEKYDLYKKADASEFF